MDSSRPVDRAFRNDLAALAIVVLLLSGVTRWILIGTELPPIAHTDEGIFSRHAFHLLRKHSYDVTEFHSGGWNFYPVLLAARALEWIAQRDLTGLEALYFGRFFYLVILGSLANVLVVYGAARIFEDWRIAALTGVMAATSPLQLALARMWYPDHLMTFPAALVFFFTARVICTRSSRMRGEIVDWCCLGAAIGLATSTKFHGVFLSITPIALAVTRYKVWKPSLVCLSMAGVCCLLIFAVFNNSIFRHWDDFLASLEFNARHYKDGHTGLESLHPLLTYLLIIFLCSWGILGAPLWASGVKEVVRHRRFDLLILVIPPIVYLCLLGSFRVVYYRNVAPCLPFVFVLQALGAAAWLYPPKLPATSQRLRFRWSALLPASGARIAALLLIAAEPMTRSMYTLSQSALVDSRIAAAQWMSERLRQEKGTVGTSMAGWGIPVSPSDAPVILGLPPRPAENQCLDYYVLDSWFYDHFGLGRHPLAVVDFHQLNFVNPGGTPYPEIRWEVERFLGAFTRIQSFDDGYAGPAVWVYQSHRPCRF
jgi:hypothetical protein